MSRRRSYDARFYKPACLIALIDGVANGTLAPSDIAPETLFARFATIVGAVFPDRADMGWRPFWHLTNDGAWTFGKDGRAVSADDFGPARRPISRGQLMARIDHAAVPASMRRLWISPTERRVLRRALVDMLLGDNEADCRAIARIIDRDGYATGLVTIPERAAVALSGEAAPTYSGRSDAGNLDPNGTGLRQGFRSSAAERSAIELRAMALAADLLQVEGWTVDDVSRSQSYDLRCSRDDGTRLFVEVKGTVGRGDGVLVTAAEVAFARANAEEMALIVVTGIAVKAADDGGRSATNDRQSISASGGNVRLISPWSPAPDDLQPVSYLCRVARANAETPLRRD